MPSENSAAVAARQVHPLEEYLSAEELYPKLGVSRATFYRQVRPHLNGVDCIPIGQFKRWHYPGVVRALQEAGAQ